jgi:hypothetical protein
VRAREPKPAVVEITVYDLATGEPLYSAGVNEGREADCCLEGQGWIKGKISGGLHRVNPETGRKCKRFEFKPRISTNRIANIPPGTEAHIGLRKFIVDETGEIEFDLPHPQSVSVQLVHPLYRHVPPFEVPCEPAGAEP